MFKIGLIGCGIISGNHMVAVDTIDDAKITAVCDISKENLERAQEWTGATGYTDYKEMIDKEDLDLVVINLPHGLHGEATRYCAEKKVNILLEKPMGISTQDCQNMIDACNENGVMLWVGHPQKYVPTHVFAKSLIDSGELGELVSCSETRNGEYFSENRPRWFINKKTSGGGIMINLGAHALDKLKFFSGSTIESITGSVHLHEGSDCEDSAQAFVRMANGITGTVNLIGHCKANDNRFTLYLTKGEIRITPSPVVEYCGEDGVFKTHECDAESCITYQMQDVIRVMRSGSMQPSVTGEYAMEIISAIKKLYGEE